MNPFVSFMRSGVGRSLRILLGLVLLYWGFAGGAGPVVGLLGLIPLGGGLFNYCVFATLFGLTLMGQRRAH
jgi:hypothetical protein